MTPRALAGLAAITVLVAGAAIAAWSIDRGSSDSFPDRGQPMFPALAAPDTKVEQLEVATAEYSIRLARTNAGWIAPEHGDYPVPAERVNRLISEIASLRRWEMKTSLPERYSLIGVEEVAPGANSRLLKLSGPEGRPLAELIAGNRSTSIGARPSGGTFVRLLGDKQAWQTEGTIAVPANLTEWIGTVLNVPGPDVKRISLEDPNGIQLVVAKPEGQTTFQLVSSTPAMAPGTMISDEAFKGIAQGILSVTVEDVRSLADVTFPDSERKLSFETTGGLRIQVRLGEAAGQDWVAIRAEGPAGSQAEAAAQEINRRTEKWAFSLDPAKLAAFQTPLASLFASVPQAGP